MAANAMKIYKVIKAEHSFQNVFVFCVSLIFSLKQFSHFISFFMRRRKNFRKPFLSGFVFLKISKSSFTNIMLE